MCVCVCGCKQALCWNEMKWKRAKKKGEIMENRVDSNLFQTNNNGTDDININIYIFLYMDRSYPFLILSLWSCCCLQATLSSLLVCRRSLPSPYAYVCARPRRLLPPHCLPSVLCRLANASLPCDGAGAGAGDAVLALKQSYRGTAEQMCVTPLLLLGAYSPSP